MKTFILALMVAVSLGAGSANLAHANIVQSGNHQFPADPGNGQG